MEQFSDRKLRSLGSNIKKVLNLERSVYQIPAEYNIIYWISNFLEDFLSRPEKQNLIKYLEHSFLHFFLFSFSFFSLFLAPFLDGLSQGFWVSSLSCSCKHVWPRSCVVPVNYCLYNLKFCVCKHGMLCSLEIHSSGGSKRGQMWNLAFNYKRRYISTTTMPMATKVGRMMTYHEGLTTEKSHDLSSRVLRDQVAN